MIGSVRAGVSGLPIAREKSVGWPLVPVSAPAIGIGLHLRATSSAPSAGNHAAIASNGLQTQPVCDTCPPPDERHCHPRDGQPEGMMCPRLAISAEQDPKRRNASLYQMLGLATLRRLPRGAGTS